MTVCYEKEFVQQRQNRPRVFPRAVCVALFADDDLGGVVYGAGDQLLGTNRGAQAAVGALAVVDDCQIEIHMDGLLRADLGAQAASDAALGAAPDGHRAFCVGVAGDDHMLVIFHRNDQ